MDEERLKQIIDVEDQAQMLYEQAVLEANLLPAQAEEQVKQLLDHARRQAKIEADKLINTLCDPQHVKDVLDKNMQKMQQREALAAANMPKAVQFVLQNLLRESNNQ